MNDILSNPAIRKRYATEKRFRAMCFGAVVFALLFLVFFFADLISKGWPALQQAEMQAEVSYSEAVRDGKYRLAVDKRLRKIVSRGWLRTLPLYLEDHPELVGTTTTKWVVAIAEVDQYLKGHPNKLKPKYKKLVDELQADGKVQLAFNTYFFTRGDSKMPELAGIKSAVVGTIYVLLLTMLFSLPVGIMTAIYLEEFAPDNHFGLHLCNRPRCKPK